MDLILDTSPFQWIILVVLIVTLIFDIEKRRECIQDAVMAREGRDPAEILVADVLVRMNWCDIVGLVFLIGWIILRHEGIPPEGEAVETLGLASFSVGIIIVLLKRLHERQLRINLRSMNGHH